MEDELAYVVENDVIQEALTRRLDTLQDRVQVMYKTRVDSIDIPGVSKDMDSNAWVKLVLNNGQKLKTKLLVGFLFFKIKTIHHCYYETNLFYF